MWQRSEPRSCPGDRQTRCFYVDLTWQASRKLGESREIDMLCKTGVTMSLFISGLFLGDAQFFYNQGFQYFPAGTEPPGNDDNTIAVSLWLYSGFIY